jgi:mono/diheme cytochrome c family protein
MVARIFPLLLLWMQAASSLWAEESIWSDGARPEDAIVQQSLARQWQDAWEGMSPEARSGFQHLTGSPYLPADFDRSTLETLLAQPTKLPLVDAKSEGESLAVRGLRFGLSVHPLQDDQPLQYIQSPDGQMVMNCFACHGGNLFGTSFPGSPNTLYALETLTEQVRREKLRTGKPLTHMDLGLMAMPLGTTVGSSNAVMFGVALMNYRNPDLTIEPLRAPAEMLHHDMDAPPWWHYRRKQHLYIDGFAGKGHRGLMQFMLVKENGPEQFQEWESDFRDVEAFLSELPVPKYPLPIDDQRAAAGKIVFEEHCSRCHGTYGPDGKYPELTVALEEVGTDPVRYEALTDRHRKSYAGSWFAEVERHPTKVEVEGYVAPPLDGIWASAPYFHNGSVPTLAQVIDPDKRPKKWRRNRLGIDLQQIGLSVDPIEEDQKSKPPRLAPAERRWIFDTFRPGKSNQGHDFGKGLTDAQASDLLEYLKTL